MNNKFLFLILSLIVFVSSCKKVDEDTTSIDRILKEDEYTSYLKKEEEKEEATEQYLDGAPSTSSDTSPNIVNSSERVSEDSDIQRIKDYIYHGNFEAVIAMNDTRSDESKYYTGIAYYCLMKQKERPVSERVVYRDKAIALLKEVGRKGNPISLRTRGLLWYAMALHLNYSDLRNNRIAIGALQSIQRELRGTDMYDDSYLVTALIYTKMGWYVQARKHYKALKTIKSTDGRVWDPEDKIYYTPSQAAEVGLERVRKICYPEYQDYPTGNF